MDVPETRYARTADGVYIAYQVLGEGPLGFVFVNSAYISNIEIGWEWTRMADQFHWLAARGRLVLFDRRGTGLSNGVSGETLPTLEARMDDIRAVMDAASVDRAILYGVEDGAAQCFLFAATYPERTMAIITFGATSRGIWAPDAPWLWTEQEWDDWLAKIETGWGSSAYVKDVARLTSPSKVKDPDFMRNLGRAMRHALSPGGALASERMYRDTDVRHVLPLIQAPTLITHVTDDRIESIEEGRYIARQIPGAVLVELPGEDHWWTTGLALASSQIDRFIGSLRETEADFDRTLATVMFTDIVGATQAAAQMGDRSWLELLERHHALVRAMIGRYRGREIDTAGDGFFATFDGPARAVRCARAIVETVHSLDIQVRAGIHTGEVESIDDKVGGIAVHIGARVGALARASEVLVSQTVKDLVAGSGLVFEDAGEHELKGVPDRWHLYRVLS